MRVQVATVLLMFLLAGAGVAAAAVPPPPIAAQEPVLSTFTSGAGDEVPYRVGWYGGGSAGFGRTKVVGKHKITNDDIVGAVVRSPQTVRTESPYVVHEKEAILVSLFGDDERLTVRVVINYGAWSGPGRQGVVTAYCVGPVECPDWINRAFATD